MVQLGRRQAAVCGVAGAGVRSIKGSRQRPCSPETNHAPCRICCGSSHMWRRQLLTSAQGESAAEETGGKPGQRGGRSIDEEQQRGLLSSSLEAMGARRWAKQVHRLHEMKGRRRKNSSSLLWNTPSGNRESPGREGKCAWKEGGGLDQCETARWHVGARGPGSFVESLFWRGKSRWENGVEKWHARQGMG